MFGIWIATVYTTRPASRGSGAVGVTRISGSAGVPTAWTDRAATARFRLDVGASKLAVSLGCGWGAPVRANKPGTVSWPGWTVESPASRRGCGPAEKPACCDAFGAGISFVRVGNNPTMANAASELRLADESVGASASEGTGLASGLGFFSGAAKGRTARAIVIAGSTGELAGAGAAICGAAGKFVG